MPRTDGVAAFCGYLAAYVRLNLGVRSAPFLQASAGTYRFGVRSVLPRVDNRL